jgi:lysophospholipase L1-like esterase
MLTRRKACLGITTMLVGVGGGVPNYLKTNFYAANHAALAYTDCVAPTFVNGFARFQRPIDDTGSGYMFCMPGGRLRFRSNAPIVNVLLRYNGLVTRTDARNGLGEIYIDGVWNANIASPAAINVVGPHRVNIVSGTSADRLYEIVLPYADGLEVGGVEVDKPYVVTAAAARTGRLMVCYGDSITQGFNSTEIRNNWPSLLAVAKNFRCINMGYGGRATTASDGTAIANLAPDLITVLMGTNDYLSQVPVATYKTNFKALLTNIHNLNPTVPVYISAPIVNAQTLAIPLSSYQAVPGAAIAELGFSQMIGVDDSTLITLAQLTDGTHPGDAGSIAMAIGWGNVIV